MPKMAWSPGMLMAGLARLGPNRCCLTSGSTASYTNTLVLITTNINFMGKEMGLANVLNVGKGVNLDIVKQIDAGNSHIGSCFQKSWLTIKNQDSIG